MHTALHDLPSVLRDQAVVKCNPVIDRTFDCIFDINCHMSLHTGRLQTCNKRWFRAVAISLVHLKACLRAPDEIDKRVLQLLRVEPLFAVKLIQRNHLPIPLGKASEGKRMGRFRASEINPNYRI